MKTISRFVFARMLIVDIGIALGGTLSWTLHLDVRSVAGTVLLCLLAYVVHVAVWALPLRAWLADADAWASGRREFDDAELLDIDHALERLPVQLSSIYALSYLVYFGGIALIAWLFLPEVLSFGQLELTSMGFQFSAVLVGAPMPVLGWTGTLTSAAQAQLGAELGARGLDTKRIGTSFVPTLMVIAGGLVLATAFWLLGTSWLSDGQAARTLASVELRNEVGWSAKELARGLAVELAPTQQIVTAEQLPTELGEQVDEVAIWFDGRAERVTAAAAVGDGRFVLGSRDVAFDRGAFWIGAIAVLSSLVWWGLATMLGAVRNITGPLARLQHALERVAEFGDLRELGRIPVLRTDGVGAVVREFNRMLDVFEQLANAATQLAEGDLRVQVAGNGDLQDAFRNMVARLAELVMQIRDAAIEVAGGATEIHASTVGHEETAGHQSTELRSVSDSMQHLALSSGDISAAADEVLANAQQTGARADQVAARLAELSDHVERVSGLLEQIRDVAQRSDLLALNGSLEATRAGEAGRGFALVAGEMRRLAERIAETVSDVRSTLADVEASHAATAVATSESRELADRTTAAAQRIVDVVHTQAAETSQVSRGVSEIADVVTSSAARITQIRSTADGLREQAARLERLIGRFEV